jgi:hypothetical protein
MTTIEALNMAANMNKCKYEVLDSYYGYRFYHPGHDVAVLISVSSIINDFTNILCSGAVSGNDGLFNENQMTSALLGIAAHYKNYFSKESDASINVYFYQGTQEVYYVPKIFETFIHDMRVYLLPTMVRFIPHVYYVNIPDVTSAVIPYEIAWRTALCHMAMRRFSSTMVLIVSSHISDYAMLEFSGTQNEIYTSVYRRRHDCIFDKYTILRDYLFKSRKAFNGIKSANFDSLLSLYLLCNPKQAMLEHIIPDTVIPQARIFLTKVLRSYRDASNYSLLLNTIFENAEFAPYREFTDIQFNLMANLMKIQSQYSIWNVDQIDYTIEKTNDTIFRSCPVDFKALFA